MKVSIQSEQSKTEKNQIYATIAQGKNMGRNTLEANQQNIIDGQN